MWAVGRYDLGLSECEFWRLTWAQFIALRERRDEAIKREDERCGILSMVVRRVAGDKKAKVWDLFPRWKPEQAVDRGQTLLARLKATAKPKRGK